MNKESFKWEKIYSDTINSIPDIEVKIQLLNIIVDYALSDKEPDSTQTLAYIIFQGLKPYIDSNQYKQEVKNNLDIDIKNKVMELYNKNIKPHEISKTLNLSTEVVSDTIKTIQSKKIVIKNAIKTTRNS